MFLKAGELDKARAYATRYGIDITDPHLFAPKMIEEAHTQAPPEPDKPLYETLAEDQFPVQEDTITIPLAKDKRDNSIGIYDDPNKPEASTIMDLPTAQTLAEYNKALEEQTLKDRAVPYPSFEPVREPLPAGVYWATVIANYPNSLLKQARLDDGRLIKLWVTRKLAYACMHKAFSVEENPDEMFGGYIIWKRK